MDLKMFTVKYCRACELTSDMLDQNPHLRPAVFTETLRAWLDTNFSQKQNAKGCENET